MEPNSSLDTLLHKLGQSKQNVPTNWAALENDKVISDLVCEMKYDLKPLSQHLDVPKALFPPLEELEDDEVNKIVLSVLDTMSLYNYYAELPEGLSIREAYTALLSIWDDEIPCCPFGNLHFDFSYLSELNNFDE